MAQPRTVVSIRGEDFYGEVADSTASVVWNLDIVSSIGGHPVTITGSPLLREFDFGKAMEFDGTDDGMTVGGCPLNASEAFTVEIVCKPYAAYPQNVEQRFLHIQRPGRESRRMLIELRLTADNCWYVDTHIRADSSALTCLATDFPHPVDRWYHIAFVYGNGVARHFVDGIEEMSARVPYRAVEDAHVSLGMRMNRRSFFKGAIRSVSMTRHALGPAQFVLLPHARLKEKLSTDDRVLFSDDFTKGLQDWVVECEDARGSSVSASNGALDVNASAGLTCWYRNKLPGNCEISYGVTVVDSGGRNDRVSDMNAFWMASDQVRGNPFGRDGKFASYDDLDLYYAGVGGHDNTTTRFRRYHHAKGKPVQQEHTDRGYLLEGNKKYRIAIVVQGGRTSFHVNGVRYFEYGDATPLTEGYFGFRTTRSHHRMTDFTVRRLALERPR